VKVLDHGLAKIGGRLILSRDTFRLSDFIASTETHLRTTPASRQFFLPVG
jgi:hypothetical protein